MNTSTDKRWTIWFILTDPASRDEPYTRWVEGPFTHPDGTDLSEVSGIEVVPAESLDSALSRVGELEGVLQETVRLAKIEREEAERHIKPLESALQIARTERSTFRNRLINANAALEEIAEWGCISRARIPRKSCGQRECHTCIARAALNSEGEG